MRVYRDEVKRACIHIRRGDPTTAANIIEAARKSAEAAFVTRFGIPRCFRHLRVRSRILDRARDQILAELRTE